MSNTAASHQGATEMGSVYNLFPALQKAEPLLLLPVEDHGPHEHDQADQTGQGHRTQIAH